MSEIRALLAKDDFKTSIGTRMVNASEGLRFIKMLDTAVNKNPALLKCTPASFKIAAYQLAELNLSPIPAHGQAYLIPYGDQCTLQVGWRGLATMAIRDGGVVSIHSEIVYKGDTFKCSQGLNPTLIHDLNFDCQRDEQNIHVVYAIATLANGSKIFEVMSKQQIDDIRKTYSKAGKSPWQTAYGEMARKTVVKRLCKYLPVSSKTLDAIEADDVLYVDGAEVIEAEKTPVEKVKARAMAKAKQPETVIDDLDIPDVVPSAPKSTTPDIVGLLKMIDDAIKLDLVDGSYLDETLARWEVPEAKNLTAQQVDFMKSDLDKKFRQSVTE